MLQPENPVERREYQRVSFASPLAYKVCRKETITKILEGYTSNISEAGMLCNIRESVNTEDILWLSFNRSVLEICQDLEKKALIYQNGVIGKVVRIEPKGIDNFDVGIKFLTREEPDSKNVYI